MAWMVKCNGCGKQAEVPEDDELISRTFRCSDCGKTTKIKCCDYCQEPIDAKRLSAVPDASICISCKSGLEGDNFRQTVEEPLGSRADFRKDSGSYP